MAATTVDTLLVRIEADMSGIRRDLKRLERNTQSSTQKMRSSFSRLAKSAGPLLGAALVAGVAIGSKAVISLASDIEEMQAKSDVVFGSFAGQVREDLAQFAQEVGRSRFELEGMAASVQDTFVPMGIARGEAADLSVQLAKLATDVASFNNAADADVMNAFQSALVGNHETVRRFGIVITEVELKQELLRMGINKASKDVDQATKIQARLNLIMAGTTDAQGDAARTSESFANQTRALKASLEILGIEIGKVLLPTATALVKTFNELTIATTEFLREIGIIQTAPAQRLLELTEEIRIETEILNNTRKNTGKAINAEKRLTAALREQSEVLAILEKEQRKIYGQSRIAGAKMQNDAQEEVNEKFEELAKARQKIIDEGQILTATINGESESFIEQLKVAQGLGISIDDLDQEIKDLIISNGILQNIIDATTKSSEEQADALGDLQDALSSMREETIQARLASSGLTEVQKQTAQFILENKNATSAQIEEFQKLAQETFNLTQNNEDLNEEFEEFQKNLTATEQAIIDYKAEVGAAQLASMEFEGSLGSILEFLQQFPDATAAQVEEFRKFAELMESLPEKTKETEDALDGIKEMTQTFNSAVQTASKGISDSFADMLMSGKLNMESLKSVFDNMVKTIISKAFELMVVNRIMNGIFGNVTGFEKLPTMGGGGIGASAGGGSISAPTLVGERGPELFVPHSAGVIKNAHDTRGMMGGSPVIVNQNLNIETGVAQTVRAEILTMMPMIQNSTLSAVQNARQRGGSFATSFGG
tara:strand:- start:645 stop:2957 length:2313 start_codon:yes stop_codon:yes gene_type:complete